MIARKIKYWILSAFFVCVVSAVFAQSSISIVEPQSNYFSKLFSIPLEEVTPTTKDDASAAFFVYVFISPECPLCQRYMPELKKLQSLYKDKIIIRGIVPGKTYSKDTLIYFKNDYGLNFPLFIDPQKQLCNYLTASVTPEVMLFTKNGERIYQGAIDDWMKKIGEARVKPTKFYLEEAIEAALNGKQITISKTEAKGCLINDF